MLACIVALYLLMDYTGVLNLLVPSQLADGSMGYGMLFVIGLITSVHCIAMCGGINLSQCLPKEGEPNRLGAVWYNLGRVVSYTLAGFILGLVGMFLGGGAAVVFPPRSRASSRSLPACSWSSWASIC